jgi:competence ComEA-like helix-hairpin-helix protein
MGDPHVPDPAYSEAVIPPSRRRLLLRLWAACTLLLAVRAFAHGMLNANVRPGPGAVPTVLDINRASVAELQALPGIGPARAEAIVLHRVRHGPFADVEGLRGVDGIGDDTVASLRSCAVARGPLEPK